MGEMRKIIPAKVLTLEDTMHKLYEVFVTMHKEVVYVHGLHQ